MTGARDIINALAGERRFKRLQLKSISKELGFGENTISGWEMGRNDPSLMSVVAYAQYLGYELKLERRGKKDV